jgi:acetylornithine deacetylase/succinyl-diaminopimelate desuccinylase-like protein
MADEFLQVAAHAEPRVVDLCRDLLRIESTNPGTGERKAAEHVASLLTDIGLDPHVYESEPGRTSVIARVEGQDRSRDALLIHGHLDVVPAQAEDWSYPPFAGEIADGMLWGRGAIDMKDMVAMTLAVAGGWQATNTKPPRDVVLAFVADEEAGGTKGAGWLVNNHADEFEGVTEAIGEVGGFSYTVSNDLRLYLIETAEKGMAWLKLTAHNRAGHGSMVHEDNAVTQLCEAVARIGRYEHPLHITPTVRAFLDALSDGMGIELDPDDPEIVLAKLGGIARMIGATLRNTTNPTMLDAGYKVNVIPGSASAQIDARFLPGYEDELMETIRNLAGDGVTIERTHGDIALETDFDGALIDAMGAALRAEDPSARAVPYMLSGGTDAKSFSKLGIRCFGFAPLQLPPDLNFSALFHGVDERVPVDGLKFGARTLARFLAAT